jgi:hypothetical protein
MKIQPKPTHNDGLATSLNAAVAPVALFLLEQDDETGSGVCPNVSVRMHAKKRWCESRKQINYMLGEFEPLAFNAKRYYYGWKVTTKKPDRVPSEFMGVFLTRACR